MAFVCKEDTVRLRAFKPDKKGVDKDDLVRVTLAGGHVFYLRPREAGGHVNWAFDSDLLPAELKGMLEGSTTQFFYSPGDIVIGQHGLELCLYDSGVTFTSETEVESLEAVRRPSRRASRVTT